MDQKNLFKWRHFEKKHFIRKEHGLEVKSKALEVNLASYHIDVDIDSKYLILQEIMSRYYGVMEGFNTFLKELSHPYKNWRFIVDQARSYSLNYFHLIKNHPKGPDAIGLFIDIFNSAIESASEDKIRNDAVDDLFLFLTKIIKDSGPLLEKFIPVLNLFFDRTRRCNDSLFFRFIKSFYQIDRIAEELLKQTTKHTVNYKPIILFLVKYYKHVYSYWLEIRDPLEWFEEETGDSGNHNLFKKLFNSISHEQVIAWNSELEKIKIDENLISDNKTGLNILRKIVNFPGFNYFVNSYRTLYQKLFIAGKENGLGNQWKIVFLFQIMSISGLSIIHEEIFREINRTIRMLITHEDHDYNMKVIGKTFSILKDRINAFPGTALFCLGNMGKGVSKTEDRELVIFFLDSVIDLGFQTPRISGVGNDWQIKGNRIHIQNIRTWLELVEIYPKWAIRLLSCLIIHLSLTGVFIRDNDLFPRDITRMLNSGIEPVYNLVKQLARLFPVYFNDIGAEGKLRDISTQLDEITYREDVLIHFLRKQSHVESSNRIVDFIGAVIKFWETKDKNYVKPYVPPDIYTDIDTDGSSLNNVYKIISYLKIKRFVIPDDFLVIDHEILTDYIKDIPDVSETDLTRVELIINFYQLICQKYNLTLGLKSDGSVKNYLDQLKASGFPELKKLQQALGEPDLKKKLSMLIDYLDVLKSLILSDRKFEAREDIYHKRHIAVDIPSMYGSYQEIKFDAMGLTFRIESLVNVLFEEIVRDINLSLITMATFYQIYDLLVLFDKALKIDGILSVEIEQQLDFLSHSMEIRGFSFTQFIDIFKGFARAVKNIINKYYTNIHEHNLIKIFDNIPIDQLLPKYVPLYGSIEHEKLKYRTSEIFFRDKIALSLGLQQLDLFISRILNTLFMQLDKLPDDKLHLLLNYDPVRAMTLIQNPNKKIRGVVYLGNKGNNLIRMYSAGVPVPPGFIITAEVYRVRKILDSFIPARQNFQNQTAHYLSRLEEITGKTFGDPKNPLLLSVRSGSAISQPGMMDTFLDVGINEDIVEGLAALTGNEWFAWDNYRRFLQCYGMGFGLKRDDFDAIINESKQNLGIPFKKNFTGAQMKGVALAYKNLIEESGIEIVQDPLEQLYMAIRKVFSSWNSTKAKSYRKIIGISDDWGTTVTVQKMVFGNISQQSGSGVVFTHNPRWSEESLRLWGDFTIGNQGEDVVSGLVTTLPVSKIQQNVEMKGADISLETGFPKIYKAIKEWARELVYKRGWNPQEIEFTFESPLPKDLYLLQTRDMTMMARKEYFTFESGEIADEKLLGHGIGVSGGAMSGRVVFNREEIAKWRILEPETSLILIRGDTVPDDIREIFAADALLTARGGVTSHASVVAHRLGKTCVVGCGRLVCNEKESSCSFDLTVLKSGDYISIDGHEGSIYNGMMKIRRLWRATGQ